MSRFLQFDNVAFSYPGMAEPLLGGVTAHFPEGAWTGIVGANGAAKSWRAHHLEALVASSVVFQRC